VIDGFNAFFHPRTRVVTEGKVQVPPSKITLTEAFIEITKYDWVSINLILPVSDRLTCVSCSVPVTCKWINILKF
jgi:small subunit ribosomal protein S29